MLFSDITPKGLCKWDVTPLHKQWSLSYISFVLIHWYLDYKIWVGGVGVGGGVNTVCKSFKISFHYVKTVLKIKIFSALFIKPQWSKCGWENTGLLLSYFILFCWQHVEKNQHWLSMKTASLNYTFDEHKDNIFSANSRHLPYNQIRPWTYSTALQISYMISLYIIW